MSSRRGGVQRVLVAIDASPSSLAAADSGARLASLLGTELVGLFVEDRALLRLSESPLALQVGRFRHTTTGPTSAEIRRQLRAQASRSRSALARSAVAQEVAWSFEVVRGEVPEEILTASDEADIVGLGRFGWSGRARHRMGSTASRLLQQKNRLMLLVERYLEPGRSVVVVHDGGGAGGDALRLAARLVGEHPERLSILVDEESERAVRRELDEILGDDVAKARLMPLERASGQAIKRHVEQERAGVVLLSTSDTESEDDEIQALLSELDCPVLVVT